MVTRMKSNLNQSREDHVAQKQVSVETIELRISDQFFWVIAKNNSEFIYYGKFKDIGSPPGSEKPDKTDA